MSAPAFAWTPGLAAAVGVATDRDPSFWMGVDPFEAGGSYSGIRYRQRPNTGASFGCAWTYGTHKELWEALATREVIPQGWVDDPARRFLAHCRRCHGQGSRIHYDLYARAVEVDSRGRARRDPCDQCPRLPHPWRRGLGATLEALPWWIGSTIAFAADVPRVLAAEAIGHEVARLCRFQTTTTWWRVGKLSDVDLGPFRHDLNEERGKVGRTIKELRALGCGYGGVLKNAVLLSMPSLEDLL